MKKTIKCILLILSIAFMTLGVVACSSGGAQTQPARINLLANKYTIEAGAKEKIAYEYDGKDQVIFTSSDTQIVSVEENGEITAIKKGTAFITLTTEKDTAVCCVNVFEREHAVDLGVSEYTMVVGSTLSLNATTYIDGKVSDGNVEWSIESSENDYEFNSNGKSAQFKAKKIGYYTIKVESDKDSATCVVKVLSKNAKRVDAPVVEVDCCNTIKWNKVDDIETYEVYVDGQEKVKVSNCSFDISNYVDVKDLPYGAKLKILVKTCADDSFDYYDSYYTTVNVAHNYQLNETVDATCYSVGTMVYTCGDCGRTYTNSNYYEQHNYVKGECTVCHDYKTEGVLYFYDSNFIPMPTPSQAADANGEWRTTYADYYQESDVEGGAKTLWIAVTENKDDIPEEDRIECYYVHGLKDQTLTEVYVTEFYDDGVHGRLPVKYVRSGAFANDVIRNVIMPEGVTEIRGSAFGGSDSLETVVAPGVKYLPGIDKPQLGYLMSAFSNSLNLKSVVLGEGFINEAMSFRNRYYTGNEKGTADIYIYSSTLEGVNMLAAYPKFNQILSGKIYPYYQDGDQIYCEDFWHFNEKGLPEISQHDYGRGEACKHCGAEYPGNINYGYDSNYISMPTPEDVANSSSEWRLKYEQYVLDKTLIGTEGLDSPEEWWKAVFDNRGAIPEDQRVKCYYVKGSNDLTSKKYVIPETYNGAQGTLPVKYIGYSAFMNNKSITEIIATETLVELRGASFSNCSSLTTAVFPGLKYLQGHDLYMYPYYSRMANFDSCDSLTKLVVAGGFKANGIHFRYNNNTQVTDKIQLYVYADNTTGVNPKMSDPNTKWNKLMTDTKFIYDDPSDGLDCQNNKKWHFDNNGIPVRNAHEYENENCKYCGALEMKTIVYSYDANYIPIPTPAEVADANSAWRKKYQKYVDQTLIGTTALDTPEEWWMAVYANASSISEEDKVACYYVSGLKDKTLTEIHIAEKINDGVHGELPVKYIGLDAFYGNKTITKVFATETLTELRGRVFSGASNLQVVVIPGVKYLADIRNSSGTIWMRENFNYCDKLSKLVVGDKFTFAGTNFKESSSTSAGWYTISMYFNGEKSSFDYTNWKSNGYLLSDTKRYEYGEVCDGKHWCYDENGEPKLTSTTHQYVDGKCKVCGAYEVTTVAYAYDANFIPMPTPAEIADANSEWRKTYEKYVPSSVDKATLTTPDLWWTQVYNNKANIAEEDFVKCYYVKELIDKTLTEVKILGTFNDGVHGELDVRYIKYGVFDGNKTITKVFATEKLTELRGRVFAGCSSLKVVVIPGVKYLSGLYQDTESPLMHSQNFNGVASSTQIVKIVVGNGFTDAGVNFKPSSSSYENKINLYVYGDSMKLNSAYWNNWQYRGYSNSKWFKYDETGSKEGQYWHFDENGEPVHNVHVDSGADGKCDICGDEIA